MKAENTALLSQIQTDREKLQLSEKNSSATISRCRTLLGESYEQKRVLEATVRSMRQSLVALPLPKDMTSAGDKALIYLPRFTYKGDGIAEVLIPGTYGHYRLHIMTDEQTSEEREAIYETLRESSAAQRELALRMLWNFID